MIGATPAVYTIPPGTPFVDALAAGLLDRHGGDPLALSRVTVLLPTRRACRSLREAFLRVSSGRPLILPAMRPLGDMDEEELGLAAGDNGAAAADMLDLPPAIAPLRRQLLLARLILARGEDVEDVAQAARLAHELATLLDQVQTEGLDFSALAGLVPDDYAEHWQITLRFLRIVTEAWPEILREQGVLDPADRRNRLIAAQARQWRENPPHDPVIAAGSTGSIPATADLLSVIARLPGGAVILPGLDRDLDDDSWAVLEPGHPQFGMKQLLERISVAREEVDPWPAVREAAAVHPGRLHLLSEAMRPAATTDAWRHLAPPSADALDGLSAAEAAGAREEAAMIALAMRAELEEPEHTAALVTPDRGLARRVAAELRRWGVEVDDSAGVPLDRTPAGAFLRLSAAMVAEKAAPIALLAALKHPLAAGGLAPGLFRARMRRLERLVLRGPRPAAGFDGLAAALRAALAATPSGPAGGGDGLIAWLDDLTDAAAPLIAVMERPEAPLREIVEAHLGFAERLADDGGEARGRRLWAGDDGEALAAFVAELHAAAEALPPIDPGTYPALLSVLMEGQAVRPRFGRHPRLAILGPLEARLQHFDLLVLGGLNEGTWPAEPAADPWMSRPMRQAFGLPVPERRIGLAAHDFVQGAAALRVLLTRATKVEGAPTVPSRWLVRLGALLEARELSLPAPFKGRLAGWEEWLDRPPAREIAPWGPPEPRPPVAARPRRLSVTQVETWMRDPYGIYARHILRLAALDEIDADPGAADRGTAIHEALDRFVREFGGVLPDDAYERLLAYGREAFGEALARPGVAAFWWPRFARIADWFLAEERRRRETLVTLGTEIKGTMNLPGPAGDFTLVAKADRIDRLADGRLAIIDYKTGATPKKADVETGYAPQLPLEAAMARAGAFPGVPAVEVGQLSVWRLPGGSPPGEIAVLKVDVAAVAETARAGLEELIAAFDDAATPYHARPKPEVAPQFSDYEHLARLKEWSAGGGEDGE